MVLRIRLLRKVYIWILPLKKSFLKILHFYRPCESVHNNNIIYSRKNLQLTKSQISGGAGSESVEFKNRVVTDFFFKLKLNPKHELLINIKKTT